VIGVPIQSKALNGLDSLLSIAQMPAGIPVATVAIGDAGARNAALLATAILAARHPPLKDASRVPRAQTAKSSRSRTRRALKHAMRIGIVGAGQLGRMMALSGIPLGSSSRCTTRTPACRRRGRRDLTGAFDDRKKLARFARRVDVVTFDWENVPVASARAIAR
jgi:phosphoglycerate dehydrogenase-like enzyme